MQSTTCTFTLRFKCADIRAENKDKDKDKDKYKDKDQYRGQNWRLQADFHVGSRFPGENERP